jgi:hypothetical protein
MIKATHRANELMPVRTTVDLSVERSPSRLRLEGRSALVLQLALQLPGQSGRKEELPAVLRDPDGLCPV